MFTFSPNKKNASIAVAGGTRYNKDETEAALPVFSSHSRSRIAPTDKTSTSHTKEAAKRELQVMWVLPVASAITPKTKPVKRY